MTPKVNDEDRKRRPRGTGSAYPHRDEWRAEFPLEDGTRAKREFQTQEEALNWLDVQVVARYGVDSWQAAKTIAVPGGPARHIFLNDYVRAYFTWRQERGDITVENRDDILNNLDAYTGHIGRLRLRSIGRANITLHIEWLDGADGDVEPLTYTEQAQRFSVLTAALHGAVSEGLLNPAVMSQVRFPTESEWLEAREVRRTRGR